MLGVLGLELLEDFTLVRLVLVDLHELLDGVQIVVHGHAIVHDFLLALPDLLKLIELLLDADHRRIVCHVLGAGGLRDHASQLLARFREQGETLLVPLKHRLDLSVSGHCHIDLLLIIEQTLLVLLVDSR